MHPFELSLTNNGSVAGRLSLPPTRQRSNARCLPLLVCLHGGSYNSAYFDADEHHSIEPIACALGVPVISVDRPGYGRSPKQPDTEPGDTAFQRQGHYFATTIFPAIWQRYAEEAGATCIVLISHSMGASVAIVAAALHAAQPELFPLAGLIISGLGASHVAPANPPKSMASETIPPQDEATGFRMFPLEFLINDMLSSTRKLCDPTLLEHYADVRDHVSNAELQDISSKWPSYWKRYASDVRVPILYALAEFDLWFHASQELVHKYLEAFEASSNKQGSLMKNTPHCIEHSYLGRAWMVKCCGFAMENAVQYLYDSDD